MPVYLTASTRPSAHHLLIGKKQDALRRIFSRKIPSKVPNISESFGKIDGDR